MRYTINRRKMLGALVSGLALSGVAKALPITSSRVYRAKQIEVLDVSIAGFAYYDGEAIFPQLVIGDVVQLKREPSNAFDSRAITLYWREIKMGYLPKIHNKSVSKLLDGGENVTAIINWLNKDKWEPIGLTVFVRV